MCVYSPNGGACMLVFMYYVHVKDYLCTLISVLIGVGVLVGVSYTQTIPKYDNQLGVKINGLG